MGVSAACGSIRLVKALWHNAFSAFQLTREAKTLRKTAENPPKPQKSDSTPLGGDRSKPNRAAYSPFVGWIGNRAAYCWAWSGCLQDMVPVVEELNTFCEGRHPLYPGMCMDGSDGEADYRVKAGDVEQCGTFYRNHAVLAASGSVLPLLFCITHYCTFPKDTVPKQLACCEKLIEKCRFYILNF